jgi:hypothetical protein
MSSTQTFREVTYTMRPQDPHGDGTGLRFETGEHGGDYPDNMPQAITVTGGGPCTIPYESAARSSSPNSRARNYLRAIWPTLHWGRHSRLVRTPGRPCSQFAGPLQRCAH